MKLGLFGAARPPVAPDLHGRDPRGTARMVVTEDVERLSGLTPIEIAAVQAMRGGTSTLATAP